MKKIFKKSLALVLSAALCLTALVGCLTVSAEETAATPTYTIGTAEGKVGDTVTVTATLTNLTEVCAQHIKVTFPSVLEVGAITDGDGNAYTQLTGGSTDVTGEDVIALYSKTTTAAGDTLIQFVDFVNWPDTDAVASMTIKFAVTVKDTAVVGTTYDITAAVDAADYDATELLKVDIANGSVTVKAATTEIPVDENITCTFGAGLSTTAYLSFVFTNSELTNYNSFELEVTRNTNDDDFNFSKKTETVGGVNSVTGTNNIITTAKNTYYYYYGIELYSLSVPVTAVLYCKDASGNVVAKSNPMTSTLKDALVGNYNRTTNAKVKTAIADAIVAAAEVQKFVTLSKPNSDYAKLALPTEGFDTSMATAELGTLADYNNPNNGDVVIAPGAAVMAAPFLSFNMANVNVAELSDYDLVVSYTDPIYKKEISRTINLADPSVLKGGSKYYAYFYDMAIYATNVEVTAKLYKGGTENLISSYGYSFDTFINARKDNAQMGSTLIALGKLGQSFRAMNNI